MDCDLQRTLPWMAVGTELCSVPCQPCAEAAAGDVQGWGSASGAAQLCHPMGLDFVGLGFLLVQLLDSAQQSTSSAPGLGQGRGSSGVGQDPKPSPQHPKAPWNCLELSRICAFSLAEQLAISFPSILAMSLLIIPLFVLILVRWNLNCWVCKLLEPGSPLPVALIWGGIPKTKPPRSRWVRVPMPAHPSWPFIPAHSPEMSLGPAAGGEFWVCMLSPCSPCSPFPAQPR